MSKQQNDAADGELRLKIPSFECKVQRFNAKSSRWAQIDYRLVHMPLLGIWRLVGVKYDNNVYPRRRIDTTVAEFTGDFDTAKTATLALLKLRGE